MALSDRVCVMNNGLLEQIGPPIEVYDRPKTRFVAAFIGTPPMNFLRGSVSQDAAGATFCGEGFELALPACCADAVKARAGANVELGIRPEDLTGDGRPPLAGTVARARSGVEADSAANGAVDPAPFSDSGVMGNGAYTA